MNRIGAFRVQSAGRTAAGLVLAAVMLSGCGSASSGGSSAPESAHAVASAIASAGGGTADPLAGQDQGGAQPVSPAEFCALLAKEAPKVKGQSTIEAMTTVVSDIAGLYQSKNAMATMDGTAMDSLAKNCPEDATSVLKAAGVTAFSQL